MITSCAAVSAIQVSIAGMYFMDAFDVVLQQNRLVYKESDTYFVIMPAPVDKNLFVEGSGAARPAQQDAPDVSADTREIQIDALLFEDRKGDIEIDICIAQALHLGLHLIRSCEYLPDPRLVGKICLDVLDHEQCDTANSPASGGVVH